MTKTDTTKDNMEEGVDELERQKSTNGLPIQPESNSSKKDNKSEVRKEDDT